MKHIIALCLAATMAFSIGQLAGAENAEAVRVAKEGAQAARNQDWDKAITLFRKAAELDRKNAPNLAAVLQQRAAAYAGRQQFDMAMSDFSEALKITPNDPSIYERRAYVEMQVRDYDKALADYSEAIKLRPNEIRYYLLRGYIYETKGDIKNSMTDTDKALKIQSKNPEAQARKQRLQTILQAQAAVQAPAAPLQAPQQPPQPPPKKP